MDKLKLQYLIITIIGLLLISPTYADSVYRDSHDYQYDHNPAYYGHGSSHSYDYGHPAYNQHEIRYYQSHDPYYSPEYYPEQYPRHIHNSYCGHQYQLNHSAYRYNYDNHIEYGTNSHVGATIVGGALGGAIANDISHGNGAITTLGVITGAALAVEFDH